MSNYSFFSNKKVLITGHTGFVGTWLSMVLSYYGAKICGLALPAEEGSLYDRVQNDLNMQEYLGDIRDSDFVTKALDEFRPDIVFHLAAFGFIQECHADPQRAFSTNVVGTANLLSALNLISCAKSIVVMSSDKVYRNTGDERLFGEGDELGGDDSYSASKMCEDTVARSYYSSYFSDREIGMCVVRASNILGGGDHHNNRLIPSIFHSMMEGEHIVLRHPNAIRPWQDVLDMCDAFLTLAQHVYAQKKCKIYNVGPDPEGVKSVRELFEIVADICGYEKNIETTNTSSSVPEHGYLGLSINKIREELGWSPRHDIETVLKNVFECYNTKSKKMYDVCLKQINDYYREV